MGKMGNVYHTDRQTDGPSLTNKIFLHMNRLQMVSVWLDQKFTVQRCNIQNLSIILRIGMWWLCEVTSALVKLMLLS